MGVLSGDFVRLWWVYVLAAFLAAFLAPDGSMCTESLAAAAQHSALQHAIYAVRCSMFLSVHTPPVAAPYDIHIWLWPFSWSGCATVGTGAGANVPLATEVLSFAVSCAVRA